MVITRIRHIITDNRPSNGDNEILTAATITISNDNYDNGKRKSINKDKRRNNRYTNDNLSTNLENTVMMNSNLFNIHICLTKGKYF